MMAAYFVVVFAEDFSAVAEAETDVDGMCDAEDMSYVRRGIGDNNNNNNNSNNNNNNNIIIINIIIIVIIINNIIIIIIFSTLSSMDPEG